MKTDRFYIQRSQRNTRHICNDQGDSLCGAEVRPDVLAIGAHGSRDLDDLGAETTCGTCRRRWAEYESRPLARWDSFR